MSVLCAGVLALSWRIPVQMGKIAKDLSDKIDDNYRDLSDKIDVKIDGLGSELRKDIREVRLEVGNVRTDLSSLSERVAHIEGRLLGQDTMQTSAP